MTGLCPYTAARRFDLDGSCATAAMIVRLIAERDAALDPTLTLDAAIRRAWANVKARKWTGEMG